MGIMGIMVYSLLWVLQNVYHQPYEIRFRFGALGFRFSVQGLSRSVVSYQTSVLVLVALYDFPTGPYDRLGVGGKGVQSGMIS